MNLCGVAMEREGLSLEAYAHTRIQIVNVLDVPCGTSLATDPLRAEAHW